MLKKLVAALNPFAKKPTAVSAPAAPSHPTHKHSFSCACPHCVAETNRLTLVRLRRQGG